MDAQRLGSTVRAVRLRRGWRQVDLSARARVSPATVSRIEHGRLEILAVGTLLKVATALDIRLDWQPRWRGGELDRMLNAGHAAMHAAAAATFDRAWTLAPETTFSIYGERGAIDILGHHAPTGALIVVELKTELVDINDLLASVDRYRRLAPRIASDRGWSVASVSTWVVLRETPANHRRLAAHASVLRAAFPDDGRRMRGWLTKPRGEVRALSLLSVSHGMNAMSASSGVQRVRHARATPDPAGKSSRVFTG